MDPGIQKYIKRQTGTSTFQIPLLSTNDSYTSFILTLLIMEAHKHVVSSEDPDEEPKTPVFQKNLHYWYLLG